MVSSSRFSLALVERFNRRSEQPTRWRPTVLTSCEPPRVSELSGAATWWCWPGERRQGACDPAAPRRGFHVLADKPWLVTA